MGGGSGEGGETRTYIQLRITYMESKSLYLYMLNLDLQGLVSSDVARKWLIGLSCAHLYLYLKLGAARQYSQNK